MKSQDYQVARRSLSFILYRGQEEFSIQQELKEWYNNTPSLQISPEYHSMTMKQQFEFHSVQLQEAIKFVQAKGGLHNCENYVPHFGDVVNVQVQRILQIQMFCLRLLKLIPALSSLKQFLAKANNMQILVSYLGDEQNLAYNTETQEISTILNENSLSSLENIYKKGTFYQGFRAQFGLVTCRSKGKPHLALVQVRKESTLDSSINEKWQGLSLQNYSNFTVSFNKTQVLQAFELTEQDLSQISLWQSYTNYEDAQICLKGLLKATELAYRYCSMRKQFRTTESPLEERPILTYQITTERILNGLSFGFSYYIGCIEAMRSYKADLYQKKERCKLNQSFADFFSSYAIEQSIRLTELVRECFGGFGFLHVSGLPGIQQNQLWIQSFTKHNQHQKLTRYLGDIMNLEKNKPFVLHYLGQIAVQEPKKMFEELGQLTEQSVVNPFHVYGYHGAKITERIRQTELRSHPYTAYQIGQLTLELYVSQKLFNLLAFRRYRVSNFVLDRLMLHQNFLALKMMETDLGNMELLKKQNTQNMLELREVLGIIMDSFEFDHYGLLVAEGNDQEFYAKLLDYSKNHNLRNLREVVAEIRKPIQDLVNRAKI